MAEIQIQMAPERKGISSAANTSSIPNTMLSTLAPPHSGREERSLPKVVRVWWVLVAHLILCIAIALCMTLLLDNYKALNDAAGKPWEFGTKRFTLRVSEVTTIISAALVAVRICISSWTAVTLWRCAFILMQDGPITQSQLSNMMTFHLPFSKPKARVGWVVTSVILLLFPQSFIGPLVTGAVGWSATTELMTEVKVDVGFNVDSLDADMAEYYTEYYNLTLPYTSEQIDRLDWTQLVINAPFMKGLPIQAAGQAGLMWKATEGVEPDTPQKAPRALCGQRVAPNAPGLDSIPANSVASELSLPCILIESISWQQPPMIIQSLGSNGTSGAQFSIFMSPVLDYPIPGIAILFDPSQDPLTLQRKYYNGNNSSGIPSLVEFPKPKIFSGSLSLLVLLDTSRRCNVEEQNSAVFGPIATILPEGSTWLNGHTINCFAYASVKVTAGLVKFRKAGFISPNTLEANDSKSHNLSPTDFEADRWAEPAMVILPDVMALVSITNTSRIPSWDNLHDYVQTLIQQSYLASWGILRSFDSSPSHLVVSKAEIRLLASVSGFRVWGWFFISMFVPLSGLIWYFGAQFGTGREVIVDAPLTALLSQVQNYSGGDDDTVEVVKMHPV